MAGANGRTLAGAVPPLGLSVRGIVRVRLPRTREGQIQLPVLSLPIHRLRRADAVHGDAIPLPLFSPSPPSGRVRSFADALGLQPWGHRTRLGETKAHHEIGRAS